MYRIIYSKNPIKKHKLPLNYFIFYEQGSFGNRQYEIMSGGKKG